MRFGKLGAYVCVCAHVHECIHQCEWTAWSQVFFSFRIHFILWPFPVHSPTPPLPSSENSGACLAACSPARCFGGSRGVKAGVYTVHLQHWPSCTKVGQRWTAGAYSGGQSGQDKTWQTVASRKQNWEVLINKDKKKNHILWYTQYPFKNWKSRDTNTNTLNCVYSISLCRFIDLSCPWFLGIHWSCIHTKIYLLHFFCPAFVKK